MSDDKIDEKLEDKIEELVEKKLDDDVEIEKRIETVSSTTAPWTVRLIFGILGVLFIASAIAGWWFRDQFSSQIAEYLPYVIIGLMVLGVGAIVESITTEIWITLIAGVIALGVTFLIVGRTQIIPSEGALYVVDRFSGQVEFCTPDGCLPLKKVDVLPKPLPPAPPPPPPADAAAPAAPVAPVAPVAPAKK